MERSIPERDLGVGIGDLSEMKRVSPELLVDTVWASAEAGAPIASGAVNSLIRKGELIVRDLVSLEKAAVA